MKIGFLIKEGFIGLKRARLATLITIFTITMALALIGIFGLLVQNLSRQFQQVYGDIQLEAYIDPTLAETGIDRLQAAIRSMTEIQSVTYISPDMARAEFARDFGEDLLAVLDENPLPPSFRLTLGKDFSQLRSVETVVDRLRAFPEIDEIVYQRNLIRLLNKYWLVGLLIAAAVGATIFLISTLLIYNTIRLTIHSRRTVIEIMKLVGATRSFIKAPFIIEGVLQGVLGGFLACGLLWLLADLVRNLLLPTLDIPVVYFGLMLVTGMSLGFIGSYISVGKYLHY